jgi:hypothetical protein
MQNIRASCGGTHLYFQLLGRKRQEDCSSRPAWAKKIVRHEKNKSGMAAHIFNPNHEGGRSNRILVQGLPWGKKFQALSAK